MEDESLNGKGFRCSGHRLIKVLSWHLPGGIMENHKKPQKTSIRIANVLVNNQAKHFPTTRQ
jgi:hypothetical protein